MSWLALAPASLAPAPPVPRCRLGAKLERLLSQAGVLSRRHAARRIRLGEVKVNGRVKLDPLSSVDSSDLVELKGYGKVSMPDWSETPPRLVVYNKPQGVVTSLRGADSRSTDLHLRSLHEALPEPFKGQLQEVPALRPVGRLDAESLGLLLFTDCSQLGDRLLAYGKEYLLRVTPLPSESVLQRLRGGVRIPDGKGRTSPCPVDLVRQEQHSAVLRFLLRSGRNRQLRRMCRAVGLRVDWLMRTRLGPIRLGTLPLGAARDATPEERQQLDLP